MGANSSRETMQEEVPAHNIPVAGPAATSDAVREQEEEDENPALVDPEPSIWDSLSSGLSVVQSAAKAGTAALSEQWASTSDSRARIACNVSTTLGEVKDNAKTKMQKAKLFGQRLPSAVFGVPLTKIGSVAPDFLETVSEHISTNATKRMFRPSSEDEASDACSVAAELQMMVDEAEPLNLKGISALSSVSLVVSYLWSLPWPLLPHVTLLNAVGECYCAG